MNKRIVNRLAILLTFFAMTTIFSSCNRGVGCPTNFSHNITVMDVAETVSAVIFNK